MKSANRSNALLVELLIVVLFFMLSATVLLQVFSTARSQSSLAGKLILASNAAQDVSDRLYGAKDAESALKEMGWAQENDLWRLWYNGRCGGVEYIGLATMQGDFTQADFK